MVSQAQFDYGEDVRVKAVAPPAKHPGEIGSICGFRDVLRPTLKGGSDSGSGITLVLVEFAGGDAVEIEEELLEKL